MSLSAQVWHVFRKDVLRSRWMLLAYWMGLALVSCLSAGLLDGELAAMESIPFSVLPIIVWLLGLLLVAGVVHADSPARVDAWWTTTPQTPHGILAAKALFTAALVLLPAMAAEGVSAMSLGTPFGDAVRQLDAPAVAFASVLLLALVLAARTRSTQAFLLGVLGAPIAAYVVMLGISGSFAMSLSASYHPYAVVGYLCVVGAAVAATLLFNYARRDSGRIAWLPSMACVIMLAIGCLAASLPRDNLAERMFGGPTVRLSAQIDSTRPASDSGMAVKISLDGVATNRRTSVTFDRLTVRGPAAAPASYSIRASALLGAQRADPASGFAQLGFAAVPAVSTTMTVHSNTSDSVFSHPIGITAMQLRGAAVESASHELLRLPVVVGASGAHGGQQVNVVGVCPSAKAVLVLETLGLNYGRGDQDRGLSWRPDFALVNGARKQVIHLESNWSGASNTPSALLGAGRSRTRLIFHPAPTESGEVLAIADSGWLAQAELVVSEWVVTARYPVTIELAPLPSRSTRSPWVAATPSRGGGRAEGDFMVAQSIAAVSAPRQHRCN